MVASGSGGSCLGASGQTKIATSPGVVHILGDEAKGVEEEYYVLDRWRAGKRHPVPGRIQALSRLKPTDRLQRFLLAFPHDLQLNAGIPDTQFQPK